MIYFIDIEASSLLPGTFSIEIAWVDASGQGENYLIRPHPDWLKRGCPGWSPESEAVHGISMEALMRDGTPVERVAARAAEILFASGAVGFSDGAGWDTRWLETLFDYGGVPGRISLFDVVDSYGEACRPLLGLLPPKGTPDRVDAIQRLRALATELVARAQEQEALRGGVRHRALADAERLWRTWRLVGEHVAERMAEEAGR